MFACNWLALNVFLNCTTQWRFNPGGAIQSLDYTALSAVMDMMAIPRKRRPDLFVRVRSIESGALESLIKLRKK